MLNRVYKATEWEESLCCNQALAWKCSTCGSIPSRQDDDSLLPLLPVVANFYFITGYSTQRKGAGQSPQPNMNVYCLMAHHHQITGMNKIDSPNTSGPLTWSHHIPVEGSGSALLPLVLIAVSILAASLSGSKLGAGTTVGYVGSP